MSLWLDSFVIFLKRWSLCLVSNISHMIVICLITDVSGSLDLPACFHSLKTICVFVLSRLEQPYLNANASFFEALSSCSRLQRLCLISRRGTFDPSATETFMERCCHVIMCHMFMGGTLVACRSLEKALLDRSVPVVVRTCCTSEVKQ